MPDVNEEGFVQYVTFPEKQRMANQSYVKRNLTHHCYMIFSENDEMIAMSNVSASNAPPVFPYQFLIGVDKPHRGKSLGKWLYAAMYQKLYKCVDFDKAYVAHHPTNKYAIAISEWMGYRFAHLETTYMVR